MSLHWEDSQDPLAQQMGLERIQDNIPNGVVISPDGEYALVADGGNHLIRQIIISTASVLTLAGVAGSSGATNGIGTNSKLNGPFGVVISSDGAYALVSDASQRILKIIISTASVSTFAGGAYGLTNGMGSNAKFNTPYGLWISPDGVYALVADGGNHLIRQIILSTASVSTLAGGGGSGSTNGIGTNAQFYYPVGVAISPNGLYALVVDSGNHMIRKLIPQLITPFPSVSPSALPSLTPPPTSSPIVKYGFGVLFGNSDFLRSGTALLVEYLSDVRRG
jgi:DNA-binding beta-propeller fold protein YncE